jgi:hypothetical protein
MAQTRAISRASRGPLGPVFVLADYEMVGAEEMPVVEGTATPVVNDEPAGPLPQQAQPTPNKSASSPISSRSYKRSTPRPTGRPAAARSPVCLEAQLPPALRDRYVELALTVERVLRERRFESGVTMPSVTELDTWRCFRCGRTGGYNDPQAHFTLTRVDEHGKERALFSHEREEVRVQRTAGRSIRQLGWLGYGLGVMCGECRKNKRPA